MPTNHWPTSVNAGQVRVPQGQAHRGGLAPGVAEVPHGGMAQGHQGHSKNGNRNESRPDRPRGMGGRFDPHSEPLQPERGHIQELTLLELSILKTGWIQPILASTGRIIIDGFHRWTLALKSVRLREKYKDRVLFVFLPISEPEAMMMTIRIIGPRERTSRCGCRPSCIAWSTTRTGPPANRDEHVNRDEVDLLLQDGIFKAKNLDKMPYSRAWVPNG